jgi:hypothetical protein
MRDDWTGGRFVMVFVQLEADRPAIWKSDQLLSWWLRLLARANATYPLNADLPRQLPADVEAALVAAEVIDVTADGTFRFHGLSHLRGQVRNRGVAGGKVRASLAARDPRGRFDAGTSSAGSDAGGDAGKSNVDAGGDAGSSAGPAFAGPFAGVQRSSEENRLDVRTPTASTSDLFSVAGARDDDSDRVDCDDYAAHASQHVWINGVGWKCGICEKARASGSPSFRDRVPWQ